VVHFIKGKGGDRLLALQYTVVWTTLVDLGSCPFALQDLVRAYHSL
jgi:hypothetical protein